MIRSVDVADYFQRHVEGDLQNLWWNIENGNIASMIGYIHGSINVRKNANELRIMVSCYIREMRNIRSQLNEIMNVLSDFPEIDCHRLQSHIYFEVQNTRKLVARWYMARRRNATSRPARKSNSEFAIRNRVAKDLGGSVEVKCRCGRVDVLTDSHIIEIKSAASWKSGIGQLLSYANEFPNRKLMLHLFGKFPKNVDAIEQECARHNIEIVLEPMA